MKIYELRTDVAELLVTDCGDLSTDAVFDAYMNKDVQEPTVAESYERLENALTALKTFSLGDGYSFTAGGKRYVKAFLAWVEENEYDEDGEWISGGDVYTVRADIGNKEEK